MREPVTLRRLAPARVTAEDALAGGLALLDSAGPDDPVTVSWWLVDEVALILGRGGRVAADEERCMANGVPILRRASGGGPVLWGPDLLALDVVVPRGHRLHADDVVASYRWLGEALAGALRGIGVDARALTPDEARAANDPHLSDLSCFAGRSPWEVIVGERKVVGLSQVRRRQGSLLQAGFALAPQGDALAGLLRIDAAAADILRAEPGRRDGTPLPAPASLIPAADAAIAVRVRGS